MGSLDRLRPTRLSYRLVADDDEEPKKKSKESSGIETPAPEKARTPDQIVMDLLAKGDRRGAVELLIDTHQSAVYAYCVRMLRDRELAEDVAQKVFTEAHRDIERFRAESSLKTWLIGIAHHRCGDAIKSRTRHDARIDLDLETVTNHEDPATGPTDALDLARQVAALEDCLDELHDDIRQTVLLRFISDMTYEEMSALLGRKADTLCVRVARALPILKRCMERKGWKG